MHTNTVNSHPVTHSFSICPVHNIWRWWVQTDTHSGHEKFLDLVDGPLEFDLGPVVCVLHCDQDVEVLAEVLPVGLPSVHLLLKHKNIFEALFECSTQARSTAAAREQDFTFLLVWLGFWIGLKLRMNTLEAQGREMQLWKRYRTLEALQWLHKFSRMLSNALRFSVAVHQITTFSATAFYLTYY